MKRASDVDPIAVDAVPVLVDAVRAEGLPDNVSGHSLCMPQT